jgi:ectoine hydroxylase-related dioxygenase (phytanoyl-CoA dioxygenase family)
MPSEFGGIFFMYSNDQILTDWDRDGYINIPIFSEQEVSELKSEAMKLFIERDSNWKEHGLEGSKPYLNPHTESKLFNKIMKDKRIIEVSEMLISNDTNTSDGKIEALQTWLYFKPPGELGRDVHQNIFYTHCDWGGIINISISIDSADEENGCLYYYVGSHKEKICYPIPDDLKDEERMKTNPSGWENERGKPIFVPGTYKDGEWIDKYEKISMPTKSGNVTFVHSHVLHGSYDNVSTDKWRCAFLIGYILTNSYFNSGEIGRERINVYR